MQKIYYLILPLLFSTTLYAECEQAGSLFNQAIKNANTEQALNLFQQSAKLCQNYAVYYEQGKTLFKLNRREQALRSFKQALNYTEANSKNEANTLARIALVHLKIKKLHPATVYIEQAYNINHQKSAKWMLRLRRDIDIDKSNHIASADEINLALLDGRAFGVSPKVQFNSITFKYNSTEFTANGQRQIEELAMALSAKLNSKQSALLIGHTDKTGDRVYNLTLSKQRAEAVKRALLARNAKFKGLLQTRGKGESDLKYPGDTEQDHRLNRRVEMQLL